MIPIIWLNNEQKSWSTCLEPSILLGTQSITIGKGPLSYFFFGWRPFLNDRTKLKIMRCQSFYVCSFDKVIGKTLWKLHLFYPLGLYLPNHTLKTNIGISQCYEISKKIVIRGVTNKIVCINEKKIDFDLWAIMYVTPFFQIIAHYLLMCLYTF